MTVQRPRWRLLLLVTALTVLTACAGQDSEVPAEMGEMEGMDHGEDGQEAEAPAEGAEAAHDEQAPAAVDGAPEIAIRATSFAFEPAELAAEAGEPVNIALTSDDILHDFNLEDADFHLAAEAGETATGALKIGEPGTYTVYCSVAGHREAGMETTLVVQ